MRIAKIQAYPISYPIPEENRVDLGIGRSVKRDSVVVKITTEDGLIGYGESHHGRSPGAVASIINNTISHLVMGMDASNVVGIWSTVYKMHFASHGLGAATSIAMSGVDQALWDIRGKAVGWPLYRLLGGTLRPIETYAGGVCLGYQPPSSLVDEAQSLIDAGYKSIKIRIGDTPEIDMERIEAVRSRLGDNITILTDANTAYSISDVRTIMPFLEYNNVGWLEEPFPPHDYRSYEIANNFGSIPLAAGENHYTRFEFNRLIEDRAITILQPDLSKTGGVTEALRIAALASSWKLQLHPHTSHTGINMAATIHFLASIDNAGYFEADASVNNLFRDQLVSKPYTVGQEGTVLPLDQPGIGIEVDEDFIKSHPIIDGPAFV